MFEGYTIYGKNDCSSCTKAKALLDEKNIEHEYLTVGVNYTLGDMFEIAPRSHRTFPMVSKTVGGTVTYVGGYEDLVVDVEKEGF
jgi:glutaredoxin